MTGFDFETLPPFPAAAYDAWKTTEPEVPCCHGCGCPEQDCECDVPYPEGPDPDDLRDAYDDLHPYFTPRGY